MIARLLRKPRPMAVPLTPRVYCDPQMPKDWQPYAEPGRPRLYDGHADAFLDGARA